MRSLSEQLFLKWYLSRCRDVSHVINYDMAKTIEGKLSLLSISACCLTRNNTRTIPVPRSINMTGVSGLTLHGPKRQSYLYFVVLGFCLCYSISIRYYPTHQHFVHSSCYLTAKQFITAYCWVCFVPRVVICALDSFQTTLIALEEQVVRARLVWQSHFAPKTILIYFTIWSCSSNLVR